MAIIANVRRKDDVLRMVMISLSFYFYYIGRVARY